MTRSRAPAGASAASGPARRAERWSADAGTRDVAKLEIPADAQRDRRFEVYVRLVVANKAGARDASHALKVLVDGALEWSRRAATPAEGDSLDLRFARLVPEGRPLRISASCELRHAQRVSLTISAEEE